MASKRTETKKAPKRVVPPKTEPKVVKRAPAKAEPPKTTKVVKPKAEAKTSTDFPPVAGVGVGASVPSFALPDERGDVVSSSSLKGQSYVLYFYPKDDTPGCTREACAFRDDGPKFAKANVRIIGVSPDKPESHAKFRAKYDLDFTLLSDGGKTLAQAFGVWVKKKNYGREYMGVERSTFLVGKTGKVEKVWRGVKVDGHSAAVHAALAE